MNWNAFYQRVAALFYPDVAKAVIEEVQEREEDISAHPEERQRKRMVRDILSDCLENKGYSLSTYRPLIDRCMLSLDKELVKKQPQQKPIQQSEDVDLQRALLESVDEYKRIKKYEDFQRDMAILDSGKDGLIEDLRHSMYVYYEGMAEKEVREYISARDSFYSNAGIQEAEKKRREKSQ